MSFFISAIVSSRDYNANTYEFNKTVAINRCHIRGRNITIKKNEYLNGFSTKKAWSVMQNYTNLSYICTYFSYICTYMVVYLKCTYFPIYAHSLYMHILLRHMHKHFSTYEHMYVVLYVHTFLDMIIVRITIHHSYDTFLGYF